MKQFTPSAFLRLLAIGALLIASGNQNLHAREHHRRSVNEPARLIIKRSPVLGYNVVLAIRIDGQNAGTLVRARTYDRYLTPGRHVLTVSPNGMLYSWRTILQAHAGQTYSYVASATVNRIVLNPTATPR